MLDSGLQESWLLIFFLVCIYQLSKYVFFVMIFTYLGIVGSVDDS